MGSHRRERDRHGAERPLPAAHGHGHGHSHGDVPDVEVGRTARMVVIGILGAVLVAVVVGLVLLRPDHDTVRGYADDLPYGVEGVTYPHGEVATIEDCPPDDTGEVPCKILGVDLDAGERVTVEISLDIADGGVREGDRVQLLRQPASEAGDVTYSFYKIDRGTSLWLLAALFVVVVVAVARLRGVLALIGLAFGGLVLGWWLLPSLLSAHPPLLVGLVGSIAILYAVLYLAHGVSMRTSAALLGTIVGLVITAGLGLLSVRMSRLSGVADEGSNLLAQAAPDLRFHALLVCTIIIAGLGVLNDVTITQASAVWELRAASPEMSRWELWVSAMRIGRHHIASTIYTIVFAYAGTALMTLLVIQLYDRPVFELAGTEPFAEEIVRSLVSSIGLVLAVPITTALAAVTVPRAVTDW